MSCIALRGGDRSKNKSQRCLLKKKKIIYTQTVSLQQTAAIPATWSSIYYDVGELWNAVTVGTRSRFRSASAYLKTKNRSQAAAGPAEKRSVALKRPKNKKSIKNQMIQAFFSKKLHKLPMNPHCFSPQLVPTQRSQNHADPRGARWQLHGAALCLIVAFYSGGAFCEPTLPMALSSKL